MPKKQTHSPIRELPSNDFQSWVDAQGGTLPAARKLDVPFRTLEAWYLRRTSPQLIIIPHLLDTTGLTVHQLADSLWTVVRDKRQHFREDQAPKKPRTRVLTRLAADRID